MEEQDQSEEQSSTPRYMDVTVAIDNEIVSHTEDESKLLDSTSPFSTNKIFSSKEELITWAREAGKRLGYVIIILSSQNQIGRRKARLRLGCERSGKYKAPKNVTNIDSMSRKGTGTKKIGCPFLLQGVKLENDDDWLLKVICESHNHQPADQLEGVGM